MMFAKLSRISHLQDKTINDIEKDQKYFHTLNNGKVQEIEKKSQ